MRKRDREKFHGRLSAMRVEILRGIQAGVKEGHETEAGDGRDNYDVASDDRDREISLLLSARDRDKLTAVDSALLRIENREYGLCEECEGEIATGRLSAMPFSRLCVTCQEESEQTQRTLSSGSGTTSSVRVASADLDSDA